MEDRVTYSEIRSWFLDSYYNYCRAKLSHKSPWVDGESEAGHAYSELENAFELPVEKLMLEVLTLIFSAGRSPIPVVNYHGDVIRELLKDYGLLAALDDLPSDEAEAFRGDLKILGFVCPPKKEKPGTG